MRKTPSFLSLWDDFAQVENLPAASSIKCRAEERDGVRYNFHLYLYFERVRETTAIYRTLSLDIYIERNLVLQLCF